MKVKRKTMTETDNLGLEDHTLSHSFPFSPTLKCNGSHYISSSGQLLFNIVLILWYVKINVFVFMYVCDRDINVYSK